MGLTERDRDVLDFERSWWTHPGAKEPAIVERFACSASSYYKRLHAVIDDPDALDYDPLLVRRLRRMRERRRRVPLRGCAGIGAPEPVTAPRRAAEQATIRGVIVLVAAVIVGVVLLWRSDGRVGPAEAGVARPTTSTTVATSTTTVTKKTLAPINKGTTTPTEAAHQPGQVKVIVVNSAGHVAGIGGTNSDKAKAAGYQALPVKNGPDSDTTGLFFTKGYKADATAVAAALGLGSAPVKAAPATPIVAEAASANVVVVLGADYKSG